MKRTIAYRLGAVGFGVALLATGCATYYYKVTDPASGKMYYTEKISNERGGAVRLKDARSKADVTLQNSEVTEIREEEFKAGVAAPAATPALAAAPATAPAPAAAPAPAGSTETK